MSARLKLSGRLNLLSPIICLPAIRYPTTEKRLSPLLLPRLLLLSLAASALAAPQMTYWNPYVVPHVYNQQPIVYAQHGVFGSPSHYAAGIPVATTRDIWPLSLSNVKDSKASFATSTSTCGGTTAGTAGTSACTIEGDVIFSQNGLKDVLCGNNAGLTISIRGSGLTAGNKYKLFLESASGCTLATSTRTEIVEITAPVLGLNGGINVYMCVDGYNVDGSNSKTAVDGMYVAIQDTTSTATTVGCGTAVLA